MKYLKITAIALAAVVVILWLYNPTTYQFEQYVKAHASVNKYNHIRTTKETDFLVCSMFYTRGESDEGYYFGILGSFYWWNGRMIENINYVHDTRED